jgi:hypothetical protein
MFDLNFTASGDHVITVGGIVRFSRLVRLLNLFGDFAVVIQLIPLHTGLYSLIWIVQLLLSGDFDRMFIACVSSRLGPSHKYYSP